MPVTYKIDKMNRLIRTRCYGKVTIEEVLEHFRLLGEDSGVPDQVDVLLDSSEQTSVPEKENLRQVIEAIGKIRGRVHFGALAIVATNTALFGMLRMFEVFAEPYFSESCVFRTLDEAETWLASRRTTTSAAR